MASLAELETDYSLYREGRVDTLEGEETRSELPRIFSLCSLFHSDSDNWLNSCFQRIAEKFLVGRGEGRECIAERRTLEDET